MSKSVLTVDDSASVRQVVSFTLQEAGYDVAEAPDGEAALAALNSQAVDLVITDLNMPNMNGIELIRAIRELPSMKFKPVIVLSTESQKEKMQEAKSAGATGWIVKPFKPEQITSVVKKVLGAQS